MFISLLFFNDNRLVNQINFNDSYSPSATLARLTICPSVTKQRQQQASANINKIDILLCKAYNAVWMVKCIMSFKTHTSLTKHAVRQRHTDTDRERERHRERERDTLRQTDRHTDRERGRKRQTERERDRHRKRHRDRQTDRERESE